MCKIHQSKKWKDYLPLVDIAYNNGCDESLKMRTFEELYGKKCSIPINQYNPIEHITVGPNMLKEIEQDMTKIKLNLKKAQVWRKKWC